MTYETFVDETISTLTPKFPKDTGFRTEIIKKNNGLNLKALIISEPGSNIFPTLYLDSYYDRAKDGEPIDEISLDIKKHYDEYKVDGNVDISFLTDFKKIKNRIVTRLVSREKNLELLEDVPWMPFLDLALIPCVFFESPKDIYAASILHKSHLSKWDISSEEVFSLASRNNEKIMPHILLSLPDFLNELAGEVIASPGEIRDFMHVLTNDCRSHGAVCMTYENVLSDFAGQNNCDIYILPSSIHEVMLLADDGMTNLRELSDLVCEVNESHVSAGEFLSNHAYKYKKDTGEIIY